MLRNSFRLIVVVVMLAVTAAAYWLLTQSAPLPAVTVAATTNNSTPYLVDVEGWYQITPQERAVTARYDMRLAALPASLPMQIGTWRGSILPPSPDIDKWFDHPAVAIERQYVNAQGDIMWLALFGSAGRKSFYLFEHTPQSCYPGTGWNILRQDVDRIPIGNAAIYAQRGLAMKDGQQLLVLYWYMWDNLERDAERGVLSFRLTAPIIIDEAHTLRAMKEDFLNQIFGQVLDWRRF
ncbi:MAG: exosortase-associated EpsI family protein [Chloroflexota bacterium]